MHTTTTNEMVMLTANCVATPLGLYLMTTFVLSVIDANLLVVLQWRLQEFISGCFLRNIN